jgi:cytochrome P450
MALHPNIQLKAQKQLDSVVGTKRLPEFEDMDSLPYIQAIVKELLRWRPSVPMGKNTLLYAFSKR